MKHYVEGDEPVPGFRLEARLGEGPFSVVWKANAPGGTSLALKIVSLASSQTLKEFRAIRLFKQIRHPNLVPVMAFWLKDAQGKLLDDASADECVLSQKPAVELIIAMGLGEESLADRLRECQGDGEPGIPREEVLSYIGDAARGIDYLGQPIHDLGCGRVAIQHCDIKPPNILVVGSAAQICDLGVARVLHDARRTETAGSAAYMAPEIILDGKPSAATDQYALAVSYYELRTGHLPFDAQSFAGAYFVHLRGKLDFSRLPAAEGAVISRATALQPERRFPSCSAMVWALRQLCGTVESLDLSGEKTPAAGVVAEVAVSELETKQWPAPPLEENSPAEPTMTPRPELEAGHFATVTGGDARNHPGERIVHAPQVPRAVDRGPRRRRSRYSLALMLLGGIGLGCLGSWLTRGPGAAATPPLTESAGDVQLSTVAVTTPRVPPHAEVPSPLRPFFLESSSRSFGSLTEALSWARDGDTVTIHSNGPFLVDPVEVQGKTLTLRAAPGARPLLQRTETARHAWQPLLESDRALTLEGLELRRDGGPSGALGPAYLVICKQAPLRLTDCRLAAPGGSATVVCRNPPAVELRNCSLLADAVALCVEAGDGPPCTIRLTESSIAIRDPRAVALSVYAPESRSRAGVRLHLERNRVRAGRFASFQALRQGIVVEARGNEFFFSEALLSYVGFPRPYGWRHATAWRGRDNRFHGVADWIMVDGVPAGVRNLPEWQTLWGSSETGSRAYAAPLPHSQEMVTSDDILHEARASWPGHGAAFFVKQQEGHKPRSD